MPPFPSKEWQLPGGWRGLCFIEEVLLLGFMHPNGMQARSMLNWVLLIEVAVQSIQP